MARRLLALLAASLAAACSSPNSTERTQPAKPVILSPANGAILGMTQAPYGEVTFSGTGTPGSAIVVLNGPGMGLCSVTATDAGTWSCTATLTGATPRVYQVRAVATSSGGVSPFSDAVTFTLDLSIPTVPAILAPPAGAHLSVEDVVGAGQIAVSGTADASATVEVDLDGALVTTVVAIGGAWSVQATVAEGSHTVTARGLSPAGNPSPPATAPFTLSLARLAGPVTPALPEPVTIWGETVADQAGLGEVFPGQADVWAIDADFSLVAVPTPTSYTNALLLRTGTPLEPASVSSLAVDFGAFPGFPADQAESEVAFLSPRFGAADGVVTAAASDGFTMGLTTISGARSGFLNGTSGSRLSQTLLGFDPGVVYTFAWTHEAFLQVGFLAGAGAAPFGPSYQVVLRDPASGAQLGDPLFASTVDVVRATASAGRSGLPAQAVLSFELRGEALSYVELDDVTLDGGSGPVPLPNGGFEGPGLDPWVASSGAEAQNVRSGARTVGAGAAALKVTRTIYAPPAAGWARLADVFENEGATTVATSAVYETLLSGLDPVAAVTAGGAAVVGWDAAATVRDLGLVVGTGTAYVAGGDPRIFVVHGLVVPPGGKVAIVQFVVQPGGAQGGPTAADVPPGAAAACAAIVAGFPGVDAYWRDLEPGVMHALRNF